MGRIEWASAARILAWVIGVSFLLGAVLQLVLAFDLLGPPPERLPDFIGWTVAYYGWLQSQWPVVLAATVAFGIGFAALGLMGPMIGRLADSVDARRSLVSAAFLGAGGIGLASQLLWLGVFPATTSPQYCDCGFMAEEIMSREMIQTAALGVQRWMIVGAVVLLVPGYLAAGTLGREAGMPVAWWWVSVSIAVLAVVLAVLAVAEAYPFDVLVIALVAGLLTPIWAIWLARRAAQVWPTRRRP
jgi:hypothetical protein